MPHRVAIIYATSEGHTLEVAGRIGDQLRAGGYGVCTFEAGSPPPSLEDFDGVIVAGSVHVGKHDRKLIQYVEEHRDKLDAKPNAFVSISMAAATHDATHSEQAMKLVDKFIEQTGWHPDQVSLTGGMLAYTRYGFIKRKLIRHIAKTDNLETDTSRDWDHTDWAAVSAFTADFIERLGNDNQVSSATV